LRAPVRAERHWPTNAAAQASAKANLALPPLWRERNGAQHGRPNFEQGRQFDFRKPANEALTVPALALR